MIYQVIHYNMIKDELPYFDQQTKKFLLDTIKKKVETQYGYEMKAALYVNAFYIEDKLYYTFDRLTYTSFFDFLKKRKIPDLRFSLSYVFETRAFQYLNPVAKYDDFYQMFKDMPNQMKTAIRKEKLMKIQSICKEED
ncbi:MAG: hypothetical protein ACI4OP_01570 [Candidatus Coprovivens sp.]